MIDADNPEWNDQTFAEARPASDVLRDVFPADLAAQMLEPKRTRGPGTCPAKASIILRLPAETLERCRANGPGWQTRMAELLSRKKDRKNMLPPPPNT